MCLRSLSKGSHYLTLPMTFLKAQTVFITNEVHLIVIHKNYLSMQLRKTGIPGMAFKIKEVFNITIYSQEVRK